MQKVPAPRSLVAVLDWKGREINLLTGSDGFASADVEALSAREFQLARGTPVLIVDPVDLLRNKLAVSRPKDQPHIAILRRFLEEEAVQAFRSESEPRARIRPAERLLDVLKARTLEEPLSARLVPLASTSADFRFLAHRVPTAEHLRDLAARAPADLREPVERIASARNLR